MAETIDQQFIEFIVKALVGHPDQVKITRTIDERGVLLELFVDPEDLGRVIGRNGGTAKSIRTLLRALGVKNDARYNLKIIDTNHGERPPRREEDRAAAPAADAPVAVAADASDDVTVDDATQTDQPAPDQVANEKPAEEPAEEDRLARDRREVEDITGGLDI
ncbi:KH domain-containing protein [Candidatus Microgenomates bacterium]|nr:KH domain-containing protein [Candidatus Microgenomates bacterium]